MGVKAAGAVASGAAAAAGPSWHGQMTPAGADGSTHVGTSPCAEIDMNDSSIPVPDEAPVSRRTRYSLAIATLLSSAPGMTQGTVEGPLAMAATGRRVHFADEWDGNYDAETDESEHDQSEYVFFDDEDDDGDTGVDDDDTKQQDGESNTTVSFEVTESTPR